MPFVGDDGELESLCRDLERLDLGDSDSVTVVDNRSQGHGDDKMCGRIRVVSASAVQSSYYARNRGAHVGRAPWLLFIDADVRVSADLLHQYFEPAPGARTGVLAGGIRNEAVSTDRGSTLAARYSAISTFFAQNNTLDRGEFGYAMTANCAIRRIAFEEVGGFVDNIRSGGDADICFRLRAQGWRAEARDAAAVVHVNRPTVRKLVRQAARHGSGAAWLETLYPGFASAGEVHGSVMDTDVPGRTVRSSILGRPVGGGLFGRTVRSSRRVMRASLEMMRGEPDAALVTVIDIMRSVAFDLGRRLPNEVDRRGRQVSAPH